MALAYANGNTATVKATKAIKAGDIVKVGQELIGIAQDNASIGEMVTLALVGAFTLPKGKGAIEQGDPIHFKESDKSVSNTAGDGIKIGIALESASANQLTVVVRLK